ncbi:odorant receptor 131-2-like [Erpetoichthys calabaricus]|uniref:odorant receptor 131-2-like n=1 Tax=Erpetoichthys calabaricus TaxID=27687 RepID=UPI00223442B8|nr:odorant receptor 131-2-like [Erpetoichthys calabaricus]
MVINDMLQLTLAMILYIVRNVFYTVKIYLCCLPALLALFATMVTPLNLAAMAVERYIAICNPLRHSQICTVKWTHLLIGLIWVVAVSPFIPDLLVTLAVEPLSFFYSSIFCHSDYILTAPYLVYKRPIMDALYFSFVTLTLLYTYVRIVFEAKRATSEKSSATKAHNTILLHAFQLLMCLLIYVVQPIQSALFNTLPDSIPHIRYFVFVTVYMLPRFLSPIMYGVRDAAFRRYLKKYPVCHMKRTKWCSRQDFASKLTLEWDLRDILIAISMELQVLRVQVGEYHILITEYEAYFAVRKDQV